MTSVTDFTNSLLSLEGDARMKLWDCLKELVMKRSRAALIDLEGPLYQVDPRREAVVQSALEVCRRVSGEVPVVYAELAPSSYSRFIALSDEGVRDAVGTLFPLTTGSTLVMFGSETAMTQSGHEVLETFNQDDMMEGVVLSGLPATCDALNDLLSENAFPTRFMERH